MYRQDDIWKSRFGGIPGKRLNERGKYRNQLYHTQEFQEASLFHKIPCFLKSASYL